MELTPKLNEKVTEAIQNALKDVKPRPAVDRIITMRITGKYAHYVQFLTEYGPNQFGVIYVGLPELKVKIHEPGSRSAKLAARKEIKRRQRQETKLAKAKKAKEAAKDGVKVLSTKTKLTEAGPAQKVVNA